MTTAEPPLVISMDHSGERIVLRLRGELDLGSEPDLRGHVRVALERQPDTLVLDLAELSFMDSTGLAVLVWAHQYMVGHGRRLVLHHPQPLVRRVLHTSGLHKHFEITLAEPAPTRWAAHGRPPPG